MQCPFCQTENREDRERCYACDSDISMLRLLVNKARQHYNDALENAERGRSIEAVDELRNALDLDRSFGAAHVVLGTLYAKQGEYDKARLSWEAALSLQPESAKAHTYLQRVEAVETSLPSLRRYRWLAAIALLLLAGVTAGWLYSLRPDPNVQQLQSALQMYEKGTYGSALRALEKVGAQSDPNGPVSVAAASLRHALQVDLRQQVSRIQELKFRDQYEEALAAISELESRQPDNATSAALATIRQDIVHYYREEIKKLYDDFENDARGVDYEFLAAHVNRFLELYPGGPEAEEFESYLLRGRESEAKRAIDRLREDFARSPREYLRTRDELASLTSQFQGTQALIGGRTDLVDEILTWMFQKFTEQVDERRYHEAELLLEDIESSAGEFRDVIDVKGHVALARRVLADARRSTLLRDAEEVLRSGNLLAAEEAIAYLADEPDFTGAELELLSELQAQLEMERDREPLPNLAEEEQGRFLKLEIADEEASRSLLNLEDWLQRAPGKPERIALLARAVASAVKLELQDEATSIAARLKAAGAPAALIRQLPKITPPEPSTRPTPEPEPTPKPKPVIEPSDSGTRTRTPAPNRSRRRTQ